jgi:hypothetical protein
MDPILYYFLCQALVLLLHFVVSYLIQYKKIAPRTGRWIATGSCIVPAIPVGMSLGWLWSVIYILLSCSLTYYIFWGGEQMEIAREKRKLEKIVNSN